MSKKPPSTKPGSSTITTNRRARFDYTFEDEYEAGLVLTGSEVKSLRAGNADFKDAYGLVRKGELWLIGMHIAPYDRARHGGHEPERERKLLLHGHEIDRIAGRVRERGLTIVPIKMYWKNGRAKVLIGIGKGARRYDKRQKIRERETKRETDRAMAHKGRRS